MEIDNNFEDEVSSDIADDEFMEIENNFEILDEESSDEDRALSDDSDCISDCSEDLMQITEKIVPRAEIIALNVRTKQCAIYFYYSTGGAIGVCASCMISLSDENVGRMYAVRKHVTESYDVINGQYCSDCRQPLFLIFPCNMCPICTQ